MFDKNSIKKFYENKKKLKGVAVRLKKIKISNITENKIDSKKHLPSRVNAFFYL